MTEQNVKAISYWLLFATILLVGWLKLSTPLLTILFSLLILRALGRRMPRWLCVILFLVLVSCVFYGFVFFIKTAVRDLPQIAQTAIPLIIQYSQKYGVTLPFEDLNSLRAVAVEGLVSELQGVARFAEVATKEFVFLVISLVVSLSIFLGGKFVLDQESYSPKNLYLRLCDEITTRFSSLFESFVLVMGAQLMISAINTFFTAIFVFAISLPYAHLAVALTFLCGLLPIIGNVLSNTIITCIALTVSLEDAALALAFLILLHKFEYFLNGKIIGGRIRNPMWLTLLALIVGERLLWVPGMILAPVFLHFIRVETSKVELS